MKILKQFTRWLSKITKVNNKMILKLLERMGRKRIIMDRLCDEPYLTRYYLFLKERKWFPFNIFLHNFHKGDLDDLHDHPWPYCTIILKRSEEHTSELQSHSEISYAV